MAPRPPERPSFEPPVQHGPAVPSPAGPPPPERPGRDPLRAMAPVLVTLAAVGVTALAVALPIREAQDEAIKHFPSTVYSDVRPRTTRVWHDVEWRQTTFRTIPWKYYSGATPPPGGFARLRIVLHCRLLGPKAKLDAPDATEYLYGDLTGQSFEYEVRDRDERKWDTISVGTDATQWATYKPATGLDQTIYADVPAREADQVALVVKFVDHKDDFNFKKTPSPRESVLRFAH